MQPKSRAKSSQAAHTLHAAHGFIWSSADTRKTAPMLFLPGCKHTGSSQCVVYSWDGDGGWLTAWRWEKGWRGEGVRGGEWGEELQVSVQMCDEGLSFQRRIVINMVAWCDTWVQVSYHSHTSLHIKINQMQMTWKLKYCFQIVFKKKLHNWFLQGRL